MTGPKRIVCLTEETTEWLYLLGEQDRIVGITTYTVRPPEAKLEKPVVSAFISGNTTKIVELKPDLVIGFSDIQGGFAKKLIEAGLNVLITNQRSLGEIFETLQMVGNLIGRADLAAQKISQMKSTLESVQKKSKRGDHRPRIFFQEWDEPLICGIHWVSELLEIAGGEDCFREKSRGGLAKERILTADEVREQNPDAIIGSWCGKPMNFEWVKTKPEWQKISAIQRNAIFEMDPSIILQPGPALFLAGLQRLQEIISSLSRTAQ